MADRRDRKNRILWRGEYQRQDGRYMYKYTDIDGTTRYVYSWTLTQTDRTPRGKEKGECLRVLEQQINESLHDGIDAHLSKRTLVNELFDSYIAIAGVKDTTKITYRYLYDRYFRKAIGNYCIADFQYVALRKFYSDLLCSGTKPTTIESLNRIMSSVLKFAIRNNLAKNNIAEHILLDVIGGDKPAPSPRHSLQRDEQMALLRYVKNNPKYYWWYPLFVFLLGTGCRIGEAAALTWEHCDFKKKSIKIEQTLSYVSGRFSNGDKYLLSTPKSSSGNRSIPMLPAVAESLEIVKYRQEMLNTPTPKICGDSGLVFVNARNEPITKQTVDYIIKSIVKSYNKYVSQFVDSPQVLLPKFSAHVLRHTFCTRMCEEGINVKTLQTIMGHKSFATTMDIYTEVNDIEKCKQVEKLPVDFLVY